MSFVDDLKAQFEEPRDTIKVTVSLNGKPYTFEFTQMEPKEWVVATRMFPVRKGFVMDMTFGYNLDDLVPVVAAQTGKRVDGDDREALTPDQWTNLFKAISGGELAKFCDAIFQLNETGPLTQIEELKKALAALSAGDSALPENSESPLADSADGNQQKSPPTSTTATV